jgi:hypothetical protein
MEGNDSSMISVMFPINIATLLVKLCISVCVLSTTALQHCGSLALLKTTLDGVLPNTGASPLPKQSLPERTISPT